jgi:hypothetical protein
VVSWAQLPPPQATMPAGQAPTVHVPPEHRDPDGQTFPQAPQFAPSVDVSTHAALQDVSPGRQVQAAETHACVAAHDAPHAPHAIGLDWRLEHEAVVHIVPPPPQ